MSSFFSPSRRYPLIRQCPQTRWMVCSCPAVAAKSVAWCALPRWRHTTGPRLRWPDERCSRRWPVARFLPVMLNPPSPASPCCLLPFIHTILCALLVNGFALLQPVVVIVFLILFTWAAHYQTTAQKLSEQWSQLLFWYVQSCTFVSQCWHRVSCVDPQCPPFYNANVYSYGFVSYNL